MTKGALAMAMVESVVETTTTLGRALREDLAALIGSSTDRIDVAAYVHRHAHPTCVEVIAGALGLTAGDDGLIIGVEGRAHGARRTTARRPYGACARATRPC